MGQDLVQETRGWHEDRGETYRMRVKETSDDYRYFPEPDLPPLHLDPAWLDRLRAALPELPAARRERYQASLGLSAYDATARRRSRRAGLFEATLAADEGLDPKQVANWVTGDFLRLRNQAVGPIEVAPAELATLIRLVGDGSISRANAREIFELHVASGEHDPAKSSRRVGSSRSPTPEPSAHRSTRCSPPTRLPWPTTGRARSKSSGSSSGRS